MFQYNGHWFPEGIKPTAAPHAFKRRDEAFRAMSPHFPNMSDRRVCVTAGGMTGLGPLEYARFGFERVYTFEPAPHVWECLVRNVTDARIHARNVALGDKHDIMSVVVNSLGSSYVRAAHPDRRDPGVPIRSVIPLDSLALTRCDWLQFDLEGYEYPALRGAAQTIQRHKPPIQLELRGLEGGRFPWTQADTLAFLASLGYREAARIPGGDTLFKVV